MLIFIRIIMFLFVIKTYAAPFDDMPHCDLKFTKNITLHNIPLADHDATRTRGLSEINNIGPGMLFYYPKLNKLSFWMHNTYVALSIGFINKDGVIFQIEDMQPNTDFLHTAKYNAQYALELAQGDFKRLGLEVGTKIVRLRCYTARS